MKVQFNPVEYHSLHSRVGSGNGSSVRSRVGPDLRRRNEVEEEEADEESSDGSNSGSEALKIKIFSAAVFKYGLLLDFIFSFFLVH